MALDLSLPREREKREKERASLCFCSLLIRQGFRGLAFELFSCVTACPRTASRGFLSLPRR